VSGLFRHGVDDGTEGGEPARMAKSPAQGEMFPSKDGGAGVFLNGRCQIRHEGDERMVLVAGMPIAHYREGDRMAAANAMVMLVECGWASAGRGSASLQLRRA